jgi:hypothetical protein
MRLQSCVAGIGIIFLSAWSLSARAEPQVFGTHQPENFEQAAKDMTDLAEKMNNSEEIQSVISLANVFLSTENLLDSGNLSEAKLVAVDALKAYSALIYKQRNMEAAKLPLPGGFEKDLGGARTEYIEKAAEVEKIYKATIPTNKRLKALGFTFVKVEANPMDGKKPYPFYLYFKKKDRLYEIEDRHLLAPLYGFSIVDEQGKSVIVKIQVPWEHKVTRLPAAIKFQFSLYYGTGQNFELSPPYRLLFVTWDSMGKPDAAPSLSAALSKFLREEIYPPSEGLSSIFEDPRWRQVSGDIQSRFEVIPSTIHGKGR